MMKCFVNDKADWLVVVAKILTESCVSKVRSNNGEKKENKHKSFIFWRVVSDILDICAATSVFSHDKLTGENFPLNNNNSICF